MDTALLLVLSIIGLFALYWVLFGQAKYNKMIRDAQETVDDLKKPKGNKEKTNRETVKKRETPQEKQ